MKDIYTDFYEYAEQHYLFTNVVVNVERLAFWGVKGSPDS